MHEVTDERMFPGPAPSLFGSAFPGRGSLVIQIVILAGPHQSMAIALGFARVHAVSNKRRRCRNQRCFRCFFALPDMHKPRLNPCPESSPEFNAEHAP
eukprot:1159810-Pelagomonas_calceolata.AAC.21